MKDLKIHKFIIAILVCTIFFVSCKSVSENFQKEKIEICFPEWSPRDSLGACYPALYGWKMKISGIDFTDEFFVDAKERKITYEVFKNKTTSIIAQPINLLPNENEKNEKDKIIFFKPAGAVYPSSAEWNSSCVRINLCWEEGFSAKVLETVLENVKEGGDSSEDIFNFISTFNCKKLTEMIFSKEEKSMSENSAEGFYNPWNCDVLAISEKIIKKKMTATVLNNKSIKVISKDEIFEDLKIEINESDIFLSSYVPENENIFATNNLSLSKNFENQILYQNKFMISVFVNEKNLSARCVFFPKMIKSEF